MSQTPLIEVSNLAFRYETLTVLEGLSFAVRPGEYTGIIGPNGGGKTTLIRILLGLIRPTSGEVRLFGQPQSDFQQYYRLGYVPQRILQDEVGFPATVEEVVTSGRAARIRFGQWLTQADRMAIDRAIEIADIGSIRQRLVGELSGGQRQRVFIARALAAEPEVLILDEPATGVDANAQERFYGFLRQLHRDQKLTILLVSHDIDVVEQEVERVLCLKCKMVCHCDVGEFKREHYLHQMDGEGAHLVPHRH